MAAPALDHADDLRSTAREKPADLRLFDVPLRERVELLEVRLPLSEAEPLFERGLLPGCVLRTVRHAPSGDPVIEADGALLALRRETAQALCVRRIAVDR